MADRPPSTLRLRIDQEALAANWQALDRLSGRAGAGAAVKADCYGLGVDRCVPILKKAGCEAFFVAHWQEVEGVARHVDPGSIAVLHGCTNAAEAAYAIATGAKPVINSLEQARRWTEAGGGACHLMIDTGINRLGIAAHECSDTAIAGLDIDVLMSHLACADEDSAMNARQLQRFREVIPAISHRTTSLANSAGITLGSEYHFDLTRPGLSIYGGVPRPELSDVIAQVAYPQAAIIQRRSIKAGEKVGYNATFTAQHDMEIGVVSIGYADGFLRANKQEGAAFRRGETRLPLLGKISMDMVVVDCSEATNLREGDWLDIPYLLPEKSNATGLSQYELLTVLGDRFA